MNTNKSKSDLKLILFFFISIFLLFVIISTTLILFVKSKGIDYKFTNSKQKLEDFLSNLETLNLHFSYDSNGNSNFEINENTDPLTTEAVTENENIIEDFETQNEEETLLEEVYDKPLVDDNNVVSPKVEEICYNYEISNPEEFRSNKCYLYSDLILIQSYVDNYNSAKSSISWSKSGIDITCDDKDFFGDACDDYKDSLEDAENNKEKYKVLILEIIKKGK